MSQRRSRLSFHAIHVEVECLEDRMVPSGSSGHGPAQAAEVSLSDHSADHPGAAVARSVSHTHLTGTLLSSDPAAKATGSVAFESQSHKQRTQSEFHVQVSGLIPATTYDVKVGAIVVGQITTNAAGSGGLELETSSKSHPFPTDFPALSDSSVVTISVKGTQTPVLLAKLATPAPQPHLETKLEARLSDPAGVSALKGEAEFESETEHGITVSVLKINIKNATPGDKLDVKIDDKSVGSILVDASGKGSLVLSSPFPANFPTLHDGSTIKVGAVAAGTFAK